jgi:GNAT superfamily N-acetyltransferase
VDVRAMPGLEHEPYAEVWFREIDEARWRQASEQARALGKTGLEVWTTDETPAVVEFLDARGYEEVRRYVISELDVAAASAPDPPAFAITTLAERPALITPLYAIALESYPDQPARAGSVIGDFATWRAWSLDPNPPEACFIAVDGDEPLGYGYLAREDGRWTQGFTAVARAHRGRGVAGAIKRAQIAWAKANGVPAIRTANETRLTQMLALNRRFGYRRLYEEIVLRGPVSSDPVSPGSEVEPIR